MTLRTRLPTPTPPTASTHPARPVADTPKRQPTWPAGADPAVGEPTGLTPGVRLFNFANIPIYPPVQPKLTVGAPNDQYEQEADRVADTVLRRPAPGVPLPPNGEDDDQAVPDVQAQPVGLTITPWVQRKADNDQDSEDGQPVQAQRLIQRQTDSDTDKDEEEEPAQVETPVQRQTDTDDDKENESTTVQAKRPTTPTVTPKLETHLHHTQGQGQPLPDTTRADFEPRFGFDFSKIRIHADGEAAIAARRLNAQAFTHGRDIHFGAGFYQPHSLSGRRLLAHELTHTVQQGGGLSIQRQATTSAGEPARAASLSDTEATGSKTEAAEEGLLERTARTVIEQALKGAIFAVEHLPERLLAMLGPLTPLFKAGAIGFLKRLAQEGGAGLLGLLKNAALAVTSPSYILGYIKGFLKGFFVEGLWGIFTFFFDLAKLALKVVGFGIDIVKALGKAGLEDILALVDETRTLATWVSDHGQSLWAAFSAKLTTGGGIVEVVADTLAALFNKAKDLAQAAGNAIADSLVRFFKQAADKLGAALGEAVGLVAGLISFEVLFAALTAGGGAALSAAKAGVRALLSFLAKAGRATVEIVRRVGSGLRTGFTAVTGWIRSLGQTAFFKGLAVRVEALFVKIEVLVGRLVRVLERKQPGKSSAGREPAFEELGVKEPLSKTERKISGSKEPELPSMGVSKSPSRVGITFGKNAVSKFRSHAEQIRRIARSQGIEIPKKASRPETQEAIKRYIDLIIQKGQTVVGRYKQYTDALWTRHGDAIVIRKSNGEFVTFLDATGGGSALNFPGGL